MFFKKQAPQQLNLQPPEPAPATPAVDPAKMEAAHHRARQILDSGRIAEHLFLCGLPNGLLTFQPGPGQKPVVLLFTSPFAASDYLRATKAAAEVRQIQLKTLPQMAQSWLTKGVEGAVLDRCPRCPEFISYPVAGLAKVTQADIAMLWAYHRAIRLVMGEGRVRSAIDHMAAGAPAAARADLEYVRDHFDCGVPYLHQLIGLLAEALEDEPAKAAALDRLKEFGPQFATPPISSAELMATATVGLLSYFGILQTPPAKP